MKRILMILFACICFAAHAACSSQPTKSDNKGFARTAPGHWVASQKKDFSKFQIQCFDIRAYRGEERIPILEYSLDSIYVKMTLPNNEVVEYDLGEETVLNVDHLYKYKRADFEFTRRDYKPVKASWDGLRGGVMELYMESETDEFRRANIQIIDITPFELEPNMVP